MKYLNAGATPCHPDSIAAVAATHDDEFDTFTVAALDEYIDTWELGIPKSLNKTEKIAAIRSAEAED